MEGVTLYSFWAFIAMVVVYFVWKEVDKLTGHVTLDRFQASRWSTWCVIIFFGLFVLFLVTLDRGPRDPDLWPGM
jgi:hypothetical protein